jgi:hypothetical protein
MEDDYIMVAFLHPSYKQLSGATSSQIADCHSICHLFLLPDPSPAAIFVEDECYEPPMKKIKYFMTSLMDKRNNEKNSPLNEANKYISMQIEDNEQ